MRYIADKNLYSDHNIKNHNPRLGLHRLTLKKKKFIQNV